MACRHVGDGPSRTVRRGITSRFVLLIGTAAVLPLLVYGLVSIQSLRRGTEQSVSRGNQEVAGQIAKRIAQYFDNNVRVLLSLGLELQGTELQPWQRARILRNHILDFPEFREISVLDATGRILATSRPGPSELTIPESIGAPDTAPKTFYVATPHI